MRKSLIAVSAATLALSLAACSQAEEEAATEPTAVETEQAETDVAASTDEVMDANTVTAEQLVAAGLDQATADTIVAGQPYTDIVAFNAALPEDKRASVLERVFVPVNLNTATEEQIKLIPGMTPKMEHEFAEYRPYEDMAEFDREIGKYVDEAEVARLRRYVTL